MLLALFLSLCTSTVSPSPFASVTPPAVVASTPFKQGPSKTLQELLNERNIFRALQTHDQAKILLATMAFVPQPSMAAFTSDPNCSLLVWPPYPPVSDCPHLGTWTQNVACVAACQATYEANMTTVYNAACAEMAANRVAWRNCMRDANDIYDICVGSGIPTSECYANYVININTCKSNFDTMNANTVSAFNTVVASEMAVFLSCTSHCCHQVGGGGGGN